MRTQKPKKFNHAALAIVASTIGLCAYSFFAAEIPAQSREAKAPQTRDLQEEKRSKHAVGFTIFSTTYPYKEHKIPYKVAVWYPAATAASGKYTYKIGPSLIDADISYDAGAADGRFPIVFYSHGATGAGTSSFFICEHLAESGYIVVAPDFLDTVCVARIDETIPFDGYLHLKTNRYIQWLRQIGLNKASSEARSIYSYRPEQLKHVISTTLAMNANRDNILFEHIDEDKIALIGHSFGAWTSLLLAGADKSFLEGRVRAVVALSGPVNEHVYAVESDNDLANVHLPVLFEYGELEPGLGRQDDKKLIFEKANRPKMLVCVKDADHLSFSGGVRGEFKKSSDYFEKDTVRRTITETTHSFLDVFLKNKENAVSDLKSRKIGVVSSLTEL